MRTIGILLLIFCISFISAGNSEAFFLPNPGTTINGVPVAMQYGDGYSYSLPILDYYFPSGGFSVPSTPGKIQDFVVIATGASGGPVNTNPGMDDALSTPNGNAGSPSFSGVWNTPVSTLNTFLGGKDLVFFFNNNQVNSGATTNQNLYAWARITLSGGSLNPMIFDFSNHFTNGDVTQYNASLTDPDKPTVMVTNPLLNTSDYVLSGGVLTVPSKTIVGGYESIPHNLGADHAAYAIFSPELQAALSLGYTNMAVDFRGEFLNNGYEQLFIMPTDVGNSVPEPSTFILIGTGLIGLGLAARRRMK